MLPSWADQGSCSPSTCVIIFSTVAILWYIKWYSCYPHDMIRGWQQNSILNGPIFQIQLHLFVSQPLTSGLTKIKSPTVKFEIRIPSHIQLLYLHDNQSLWSLPSIKEEVDKRMTKLTIDMPPPLSHVSTLAPSEQHLKNNGQMMCRRKLELGP